MEYSENQITKNASNNLILFHIIWRVIKFHHWWVVNKKSNNLSKKHQ